MNKKIKQNQQKIVVDDILARNFYPSWFFTNERIGEFLLKAVGSRKVEKIFSVGGGGDFALNCLSLLNGVSEIDVCDSRNLAAITIDFKIGLVKQMSLTETLGIFLNNQEGNKKKVYQRIREEITPPTRELFDAVLDRYQQPNFLKCIKKSGYWYRDSFWQVRSRGYLFYLTEKGYQRTREKIDGINIYVGDANDNLKTFDKGTYDLIYMSNVLDGERNKSYLPTIREKMKEEGIFVVATQDPPRKKAREVIKKGFRLFKEERHNFSIIESVKGHYCYSFLAFKKE